MLTKKDFIAIANIIKKYDDQVKEFLTDDFTELFGKQNPRFDHKKFRDYVWSK